MIRFGCTQLLGSLPVIKGKSEAVPNCKINFQLLRLKPCYIFCYVGVGTVEVSFYIYISNINCCSNISLLECSPATQATLGRFPAETCSSRGAQVENRGDSP